MTFNLTKNKTLHISS